MPLVIGVRFRNAGRRSYYQPGQLDPALGAWVVVPTAQGPEVAEVCQTAQEVPEEKLTAPLREAIRMATPQDLAQRDANRLKEKQAFETCRERIQKHGLDMKLVDVEYSFDNSKLTAFFTSGGRVDFRALVKDLAGIFRTRIELKQIGVRDEARMLTGLGSCGRNLCCSQFLYEFQPVSIRMAKEQSLSLNPTKISGLCGRLMCCLKYEQDQYERSRKRMPRLGREVITPQGRGIVTALNPLLETVQVRVSSGDSYEIRQYPADQVQKLGQPQAKAGPAAAVEADKWDAALDADLDEEFLGTPVEHICENRQIPEEE